MSSLTVFAGSAAAQSAPDCSSVSYSTDGGDKLIDNVDKLQCMNQSVGDDYRLTGDIDASGTSSWNGGNGFVPVGNASSPFTGSLDGDGHVVTGLTVDNTSKSDMGLLGNASGATVQDIGVENVDVSGDQFVGGLAGAFEGTITNSYATGEVFGRAIAGGLVGGFRGGDISDSNTDVFVEGETGGDFGFGGFVGGSYDADTSSTILEGDEANITNSYAEGKVNGSDNCCVGGFSGVLTSSGASEVVRVENSYSTGNVSATGCCVGGFAGNPGSTGGGGQLYYNSSYATGNVDAKGCCIGGFSGLPFENVTFIDSYATGRVDGTGCCIGGFGGYVSENSEIESSYSTGYVNGTGCCIGGHVGGAATGSDINNSYSTGNVKGAGGEIGGFAGTVRVNITNSVALGSVSSEDGSNSVGGFIGRMSSFNPVTVEDSFAAGNVLATGDNVGGFIGDTEEVLAELIIRESFASGNVTGNDSVGGFVGLHSIASNSPEIDEVYSIGIPTATNASASYEGGLVGQNDSGGPITNSYWDEETSGTSVSDGGVALTTSQMTGADAPGNMTGFDFTNTWATTDEYPLLISSIDSLVLSAPSTVNIGETAPTQSAVAVLQVPGVGTLGVEVTGVANYASSDTGVVNVSTSGVLEGVVPGTSTITAQHYGFSDAQAVNVPEEQDFTQRREFGRGNDEEARGSGRGDSDLGRGEEDQRNDNRRNSGRGR